MIKRVALLLMILMLSVATPALAAEPANGIIQGKLVNGTAGGSSVADQTVTLTTFLNDADSGTRTAKTGANGQFTFDGLATGSGYGYEVKVTFQEADYNSERVSFAANETAKSVTLTVYDSTSSAAAIKMSAAHTIVSPAEGGLEVVEYLVFSNGSDRSYIGSGEITTTGTRRTLRLPLPAKATDLQYGGELMSCCVLQDTQGLFDTMAVLPGEKLIAYSYKVGYKSSSYKFSQKVDYPIAVYNFLVAGENIGVTSNGLTAGGITDIQGVKYNMLSGGNLVPGQILDVELSGLPKSSNQQAVIWVLLTLAVLGGGGGFVYLMRKRNLQTVSVTSQPRRLRQRLLLEIARLDDDYESGKIEKEAYTRARAGKKAQLLGLIQSLKEESGRG